MIIVDILLALSLTTIFVVAITQSSNGAQELFERAKIRSEIIQDGEFEETIKSYGNDRVEIVESSDGGEIEFSEVESSTKNYLELAGTPLCTAKFIGNPTFRQIILPIDPLLPLTDIEVRSGIAYISTDSTSAADPDLIVIDFKDSNNIMMRSSIDTGPGLRSIALARNRIYAAAASTFAQLHVILIEGLDNLVLDNRIRLATSSAPFGSSIFYNDEKIYLGTEKWQGQEFSIFNVSEPSEPEYLFGFETGSKINDIYAEDDIAFIAGSDEEQLRLVDVSDEPELIESLTPSGWERQEGKVVNLFENEYIFGRTSGGFNIKHDHELFRELESGDVSGGVYGIVSDKSRFYLISRDIGKEFQIWDKDMATSTRQNFSLSVAPQALTCDGSNLYILAHSAPIIYEIPFE